MRGRNAGRAGHAQRLVRPLGVVAGDEVVEAGLLPEHGLRCRAGGLQLQSEVHALRGDRSAAGFRLDALDLDAEPQPPDGELGEVEERIGACEGHTIVGADGSRQAELFEGALKNREGRGLLGALKRLAGDGVSGCRRSR